MDVERSICTLNNLRDIGVKISIDDFGTGYSSLNYLSKLPIDKLKIDQSFVRNIADTNNQAIVSAIIALAHSLKLGVVAEGVETEDHIKILKQFGCNEAQGYYYSRPISLNELREKYNDING